MRNGSHMDVHKIYHLTVVHLFKRFFNLGPDPTLFICYGLRTTLIRRCSERYVDTNEIFCRYRLPISQWTTISRWIN